MDINQIFDSLKKSHANSPFPENAERKAKLKKLKALLQYHAEDIAGAIRQDFIYRAPNETLLLEVFPTISAVKYCIKSLSHWTKLKKVPVSLIFKPASAYILPQPLGVVGILVPWNYPLYLALAPAAYALAAGNRVMIKMSELSDNLGALLKKLMQEYSLNEDIQIITGDVEVSKTFASLPLGHLLFTGSTQVGRMVMESASKNLTPVTLELGGKSPVVISESCNTNELDRIFAGKCMNSGQTCISPDYLIIPPGLKSTIIEKAQNFFQERYSDWQAEKDYSSIISVQHLNRLKALLQDAEEKGAEVVALGEIGNTGKLPLVLVFNVSDDMKIMQQEIFGPLLPVIIYDKFAEAIDYINQHPNPLALYYFGNDHSEINMINTHTLSGAVSINETILHIVIDELPFGGVGESGMGSCHGERGFEMFSKMKPILKQSKYSLNRLFYPPHGRLLKLLLKFIGGIRLTS